MGFERPYDFWVVIPEFPDYGVNPDGEIINLKTDHLIATSFTNHGHAKVSLVNEHGRFTRSVSLLVAQEFVEAPDLLCDQVIVLDGNLSDVRASNLAWRPQWFAWKYVRQQKIDQPMHYFNLRVTNLSTGVEYDSILSAGMSEGLLFDDIWRSTYTNHKVFPNGHSFEITERV